MHLQYYKQEWEVVIYFFAISHTSLALMFIYCRHKHTVAKLITEQTSQLNFQLLKMFQIKVADLNDIYNLCHV